MSYLYEYLAYVTKVKYFTALQLQEVRKNMFSKRKLNQAYKITGKLRIIFILPIITGLLLVLLSLGIFVVNINAGYVMFIFTSIYIIINIFLVCYMS